MKQKVKELNNRKDGDRNACVICNPPKDRIPMWVVWAWSLENPGVSPWRGGKEGE